MNDIKVEYHPYSKQASTIHHSEEVKKESSSSSHILLEEDPWEPWSCRCDFEFAEVALQGGLNKAQINILLKIIWAVSEGKKKFTLKSYNDVAEGWSQASVLCTPVSYINYKIINI